VNDKACFGCGRWLDERHLDHRGYCQDCAEAYDSHQAELAEERQRQLDWDDEHDG